MSTNPYVNVRDLGAMGDGVTNDTTAFQQAAALINSVHGGMLVIPPGDYIVGRQKLTGIHNKTGSYIGEDILFIHDCERPVVIEGAGAVLKAADGLHSGFFDPVSGKPSNAPTDDDASYVSTVYFGMIRLEDNAQVTVRNIELDGNILKLELGAPTAGGFQETAAYGIYANRNQNVLIENVHTHHHGLDGVAIIYKERPAPPGAPPPVIEATPHTLVNVVSEYNARQALSWVGGIGVTAINCKFNHTGRAAFHTAPASGLDIELEGRACSQGYFVGCEFVNNFGGGLRASHVEVENVTFKQCLFWGTDDPTPRNGYSILTQDAPRFNFEDCRIYGTCTIASPRATFTRCHFEDREHPSFGVFRRDAVVELVGDHLVLEDCVIIANQLKGVRVAQLKGVPVTDVTKKCIRNTTIIHKFDGLPDQAWQSSFRGCVLEKVRFEENIRTPSPHGWFIDVDGETEIVDSVYIQGPTITWSNSPGRVTGEIGQPKLSLNQKIIRPFPVPPSIGQVTIAVLDVQPPAIEPPISGSWNTGDIVLNGNGKVISGGTRIMGWVFIAGGTPSPWKPFGSIDI